MDEPEIGRTVDVDDLNAACNSLGQTDQNDGVYMKDRDCKSCLKEIIRHLNNDDKQHTIRNQLGEINIVKSDLIPIINQYCDFNDGDIDLFNIVLRLCTNLTSSVLLLFENQELSNDQESVRAYNRLIRGLYKYKEAFASDAKVWETLNTHLRHTEDEVPFERLLILIRNILHVPIDSTGDHGFDNDLNAHLMCLHWMDKSGVLQTLIDIASDTQRGTEFCLHIMEIVFLMLREKNPQTIAEAKAYRYKRKLEEDDADKRRLDELRAREKRNRVSLAAPRFRNASFVVQNVQSVSEAPQLIHHIGSRNQPIEFDHGKTSLKKNRNRKPFNSELSSTVLSDRDKRPTKVDYSLRMFCKQFTEKVYSNYMQQIKHNLIQKKAAENDESYYLWAIQFFTSFNRHMRLSIDNISETLSTSTLHFIQILINDYQDKLKVEKKRHKLEKVSKRLHLALRAYREILLLIQTVTEESEFSSLVSQIKKKIFTEVEYNNMLLSLFHQYDDSKHCSEYLKDLIAATDIFLDLGKEFQSMSSYYCSSDIVRAYSQVLKDFKRNDSSTNLAILKYFERLANDHHMGIMLMQASIFKTLIEVVDEVYITGHQRFVEFTKTLSHEFIKIASDNKRWMFQELLFWKSHGDVIEIEHDPQSEQVVTADNVDDAEEGLTENKKGDEETSASGERDDIIFSPPRDEAPYSPCLDDQLSPLSQISGVDVEADQDDCADPPSTLDEANHGEQQTDDQLTRFSEHREENQEDRHEEIQESPRDEPQSGDQELDPDGSDDKHDS